VHGRGKANHDIDLPEGKIILLSVQCYTLTEYKFTCMCVCPSHFLSTRLQVRPLNGFLQLIV